MDRRQFIQTGAAIAVVAASPLTIHSDNVFRTAGTTTINIFPDWLWERLQHLNFKTYYNAYKDGMFLHTTVQLFEESCPKVLDEPVVLEQLYASIQIPESLVYRTVAAVISEEHKNSLRVQLHKHISERLQNRELFERHKGKLALRLV